MAKVRTLLPDATFSFDDTSVVLLNTSFLNFEFIMALNKAYGLQLARVEDLMLAAGVQRSAESTDSSIAHPCFSCYNDATRLAHVMIERPAFGEKRLPFDYYDKLLLIRGRDSWDFQNRLYHDLTDRLPEPEKNEWLKHSDWENLQALREGIFTVDTCSFSPRLGGEPVTTLYTGPADKMPSSTKSFLKQLKQFLTSTFDSLQWHLCDEEEF